MLSLSSTLFRVGLECGGSAQSIDRFRFSQVHAGSLVIRTLAQLASADGSTPLTQQQAVQLASSLAVVWQLGRVELEIANRTTMGTGLTAENFTSFVLSQVEAAYAMLEWLQWTAPPEARASFARGFAKPDTVLPWLDALAKALEMVAGSVSVKAAHANCCECGCCLLSASDALGLASDPSDCAPGVC
jgi:hypothetical protein